MDTGVLHRAIDDLADQDPSSLSDAEVHELTIGLARARVRVDGVLMAALDVWDARGIWSDDGSKSPVARLAREANWSKSTASIAIRRARALRRLPATAAAVTEGAMGTEFVDLVEHAATVDEAGTLTVPFADCEPVIVAACIESGHAESKDAINRWIAAVDPADAAERARKRFERRGLDAADTIDGLVHVNGLLDAVGGHEVLAELRRLESCLHRGDRRDPEACQRRTARQRRADALVEMARRSAALSHEEVTSGTPARLSLTVVLGLNDVEQLCELAEGTPISPRELVPHLHRSDVERIVFDGPDRVLSISHRRSFPAAVRRAIELRDRRCTHPCGCDDRASWCDVDHVHEHARGGETSERNGRLQCPTHNRNETLHHRAPPPGTPRTARPPRGWIPPTPNFRPRRAAGDRIDGSTDDAHDDDDDDDPMRP